MAIHTLHHIIHTLKRSKRRLHSVMYPLAALCISATSCDNGGEDPESKTYEAQILVDWSECGDDIPSGMTIIFHNAKTGKTAQTISNNTSCATAALTTGPHWATIFNLTVDEFENICFRGLESAETAEAYARMYTGDKWHTIPIAENSYVACQPEWLATDTILTTEVEPLTQPKTIGTLHPRNIIHTLTVNVNVGNSRAMIAARAAISGLAAGRRLAASSPNSNNVTVTQLIESNSWTRAANSSLQAQVRCFGLPDNHQGMPQENIFEFQALLSDRKTVKTYTVPVGHLLKAASQEGGKDLSMYLELHLSPPLPTTQGSGGIDVWLEDWDESIDIIKPL